MRLDELQDCLGWEQAEFDGLYKEFCAIESNPSVDLFMAWMRAYGHLDLGTYTRIQDLGEVEVQELDELQLNSRHKDPHQVLAEVGHGAMGQVLLAREEDLGRRVAVKRLHEEDGSSINVDPASVHSRFYREAQITAQLEHPCIVPIYRLSHGERGELSYSMKLIHGDTMEHYLCDIIEAQSAGQKLEARYQLPARLRFLLKVCDAVSYAHSRGVIHRDLKPANIMIGRYNQVYVMDWGIARRISVPDADLSEAADLAGRSDDLHLGETQFGVVMGTPAYMAPEQANGDQEAMGGWTDQYSLGLILQELITLEQANPGPDVESRVMHAMVAWRKPFDLNGSDKVPRELAGIIGRACAAKPEQRYPSVDAMAADILRYLDGLEVEAAPDSRIQRVGRWISRNRQKTMLGFVGLLVILFASTTYSLYREQQNQAEVRRQEQEILRQEQEVLRQEQLREDAARQQEEEMREQERLAAQREAEQTARAEARQMALGRLITRVGLQSQMMDRRFLEYEGLVQSISAAALQSMLHAPVTSEQTFLEADYLQSGLAPPDMRSSPIYRKRLSLHYPVFKLAPSVSEEQVRDTMLRLSTLRHTLREDMLRSDSESALQLSESAAQALVFDQGVPMVWAMVGIDNGVHMGYPGAAGYSADYDPRLRAWYQHAEGKTGPQWAAPYVDDLGMGLLIPCVMAIYRPGGEFLGVAGVDVSLDRVITELMEMDGMTGVRSTYLLNEEGRVVIDSSAAKDESVSGSIEELPMFPDPVLVDRVRQGLSGHMDVWTQFGAELLIFYRLESLGWFYVVQGDADSLMGTLNDDSPKAEDQ